MINTNETQTKISVLLVEPDKYPKMIEIDDTLEAMQKAVGGNIEEYMPYEDDVAIICNDGGKYNGMLPNRAIYLENDKNEKEMVDIIFGPFFVCHAPIESEKFLSLSEDMAKKYRGLFKYPERFFKKEKDIVAVPYKPISREYER